MDRWIRLILIAAVVQTGMAVGASAQDTGEQERRKDRLEREISLIDKQLKVNESKSRNAVGRLSLIQKQISNREKLIGENEKEIRRYASLISRKRTEIRRLENRFDTLSLYCRRLIRSTYAHRDVKVWYLYLLSSENTAQAFRRFGYLKNMAGRMKEQADKLLQTKHRLEEEREKLERLKKETQDLRDRRLAGVKALDTEKSKARKIVDDLKRNRSRYRRELEKKRRQVDALNREIARIIREAAEAKGGRTAAADPALDAEFSRNKGKLPWPAEGPVIEPYGQRFHPVFKNLKMPFNQGIGIALPDKAEIRAVFDGTVAKIAVLPGYNKCVLLRHGSYFSLYCKLGTVCVKAGDKVRTGQVIGTVDTIDENTQLHFQIWKGRNPDNPALWLRPR